jgi:hypothetical protein
MVREDLVGEESIWNESPEKKKGRKAEETDERMDVDHSIPSSTDEGSDLEASNRILEGLDENTELSAIRSWAEFSSNSDEEDEYDEFEGRLFSDQEDNSFDEEFEKLDIEAKEAGEDEDREKEAEFFDKVIEEQERVERATQETST